MTTIDRNNKDALTKAIDFYREEVRGKVTRCFQRIPYQELSETVRQVLTDRRCR